MSLEFLTWAMTMTIAIISILLKERYVECRHHHAPAQTLRDHSTSMQELSTTHPKHDSLVIFNRPSYFNDRPKHNSCPPHLMKAL